MAYGWITDRLQMTLQRANEAATGRNCKMEQGRVVPNGGIEG